MNAALQIGVDLEQSEIRLGTERVRLLPVAGDVFCLHDARGPLVRVLKFEERARLLNDAGERDVASLVADAALVSPGVSSDEIRIAASLALAGGGEKAPAFPDCAEFVEQRYGWDEKRVAETMALVIDRLCSQMVQQDASGWKQIVFQKTDADLGALISQMASNLSQRAVNSDRRVDAEPETIQTKSSTFDSRSSSPSSHGLVQSSSSVLPVKRAPFRVRAVNTPAIAFSASNEPLAAPAKSQSVPLSTTIAPPSLKADLAALPKPPSNRVNFSLSQAAAASAKIEQPAPQPVATFPAWQPFQTSVPETRPSSETARTNSRAFAIAAPETQSSQDWLAEVAQLLEAECDMRGIDP